MGRQRRPLWSPAARRFWALAGVVTVSLGAGGAAGYLVARRYRGQGQGAAGAGGPVSGPAIQLPATIPYGVEALTQITVGWTNGTGAATSFGVQACTFDDTNLVVGRWFVSADLAQQASMLWEQGEQSEANAMGVLPADRVSYTTVQPGAAASVDLWEYGYLQQGDQISAWIIPNPAAGTLLAQDADNATEESLPPYAVWQRI